MGRLLTTDDLKYIGEGLQRPECVAALASGEVYASDRRGGISRIEPDRKVELICQPEVALSLHPNGFSILPGREFLVANLAETGGVWRISRDGEASPFITEVEGRRLPGTNFVGTDAVGRVWISISSWRVPRIDAAKRTAKPDGMVLVADKNGIRVAANGLAYTNEVRVHPSGDWLYVNETLGRRLIRFRIGTDSELFCRETVTEFEDGSFPDGMAFDAEGCCWVACVGSQRVIRVDARTGEQEIVLDESTPELIAGVEEKFAEGETWPCTDASGKTLGSVSGLCFGGADLRTVYLGSLSRTAIATFRSPVPGARPHYWEF